MGTLCLSIHTTNTLNPAYAQLSKIDIEKIDNDIDKSKQKIKELDKDIEDQVILISQKEKLVDQKKEELRETKRQLDTSWTAYQNVSSAEQDLVSAENVVRDEKDELQRLIKARSLYYDFIRENEIKLIIPPEPIKIENPDLSGLTRLVGVELSSSCLLVSACPTYFDLSLLDSSNQDVSGKILESLDYRRGPAQLKESWRWYDTTDNPRVIVDPPNGMGERIKMITIIPNFDHYTLTHDMIENNTRVIYQDRYIEHCRKAVINADVWKELLPITLHDLRTDCIEKSEFDERKLIPINKTEIDITTSPNWQYQQELAEIKERCKVRC